MASMYHIQFLLLKNLIDHLNLNDYFYEIINEIQYINFQNI